MIVFATAIMLFAQFDPTTVRVVDSSNKAVSKARVFIWQGGVRVDTGDTNAQGEFVSRKVDPFGGKVAYAAYFEQSAADDERDWQASFLLVLSKESGQPVGERNRRLSISEKDLR